MHQVRAQKRMGTLEYSLVSKLNPIISFYLREESCKFLFLWTKFINTFESTSLSDVIEKCSIFSIAESNIQRFSSLLWFLNHYSLFQMLYRQFFDIFQNDCLADTFQESNLLLIQPKLWYLIKWGYRPVSWVLTSIDLASLHSLYKNISERVLIKHLEETVMIYKP